MKTLIKLISLKIHLSFSFSFDFKLFIDNIGIQTDNEKTIGMKY
jgi:hypothetical protein